MFAPQLQNYETNQQRKKSKTLQNTVMNDDDPNNKITNMSQVTSYNVITHKVTSYGNGCYDDQNTVVTIDTDTVMTTPPSSCPATPIPPTPAKPEHKPSAPVALIGGPRPAGIGGRIRMRLAALNNRKEMEAEETKENPLIAKLERDEYIFQKRLDIVMKNPELFRRYQARVRESEVITPVGCRIGVYNFFADMKIAELVDDLKIEQDIIIEEEPRCRFGFFPSFGYLRTSTASSSSSSTASSSTTSYCPATPSSSATAPPDKFDTLQRGHMFRSSGRRHTGGSHCSTITADADDRGAFSFESLGLTLPSLDNTTECPGEDLDDYSSVGSVSVSGWLNAQPPNSGRSLNGRPSSGRSLLGIPKEEQEEEEEEEEKFDDAMDL